MTQVPILPALDQVLAHCQALTEHLSQHANVGDLAFLVRRLEADFEIAIEALLVGRQSVVADSMRDVMEIEMLLRDFAARPQNVEAWVKADNRTLQKTFSPKEVRRRLANDLYPGKGLDLPEADEYAVHSAGLHPSPEPHPHREKGRETQAGDLEIVFQSGEILEHAVRAFVACDLLLGAFDPAPQRPAAARELSLLLDARDFWASVAEPVKEEIGMTPRGPRPRKDRDPALRFGQKKDNREAGEAEA